MTPEEIKALIKAKLEGQGTAIDAASVLPSILNGILDIASQGGGGVEHVKTVNHKTIEGEGNVDIVGIVNCTLTIDAYGGSGPVIANSDDFVDRYINVPFARAIRCTFSQEFMDQYDPDTMDISPILLTTNGGDAEDGQDHVKYFGSFVVGSGLSAKRYNVTVTINETEGDAYVSVQRNVAANYLVIPGTYEEEEPGNGWYARDGEEARFAVEDAFSTNRTVAMYDRVHNRLEIIVSKIGPYFYTAKSEERIHFD